MHPAPADVHVWMVVHLFRDLGDLVHQADGGGKVRRDGGPAQRLVVTRPRREIVELSFDLVSVEAAGGKLTPAQQAFRDKWLGSKVK
jgi:hypothetical protein